MDRRLFEYSSATLLSKGKDFDHLDGEFLSVAYIDPAVRRRRTRMAPTVLRELPRHPVPERHVFRFAPRFST
ncbi:MAG: hypothetical protein ACRBN8_36875 [Nannocystales bacterium]